MTNINLKHTRQGWSGGGELDQLEHLVSETAELVLKSDLTDL